MNLQPDDTTMSQLSAALRSNVVDLNAYRRILRPNSVSRESLLAASRTSAPLSNLVWPPLMFPMVWTSHWMLTVQNTLAPRDRAPA